MTEITAALCWYDEKPEHLERLVRSLEGVCSHLVTVDGRWLHFPGAVEDSPEAQRAAIATAADKIGIGLSYFNSGKVGWADQVTKRSFLMQQACKHGEWVLVIDGDEWVEQHRGLHERLAGLTCDVARVMSHRYGEGIRTPETPIRRLYRASRNVHVERAHNGYRAADGGWLHGDPGYVTLEQCADEVAENIVVAHDIDGRLPERAKAKRDYYVERRRHMGASRWL